MKKHILHAVAAAAIVGAVPFAAFAQNAAIVNGKPVPKARMDVLAQQLAAAGRPVTPEMQDQLREEVIAREVFMQEAQKQGLDATEDYKNQLELARQAILIRQLFENYRKTNPVSDADAKAEYDKFAAANSGKSTRRATSWSRRKTRPRRSWPTSRRAPSSRTSPRSRARTPAPAPTAATSTGPRRRASCPNSPRRWSSSTRAR